MKPEAVTCLMIAIGLATIIIARITFLHLCGPNTLINTINL
jgi:hypothetical protein